MEKESLVPNGVSYARTKANLSCGRNIWTPRSLVSAAITYYATEI